MSKDSVKEIVCKKDDKINLLSLQIKNIQKHMSSKDSRIENLNLKVLEIGVEKETLVQKVEDQDKTIKLNNVEIEMMKRDLKCKECEFESESLENIIVHMATGIHLVSEKNLSCNMCDFTSQSESDLTDHLENHTTKFKEFKFSNF